ncbi:MAG: hypothetical protein EBU93_07925, partial [Chlamydiae bacterium]|nr:hypothetical protein [Chlamydiota bacterium]
MFNGEISNTKHEKVSNKAFKKAKGFYKLFLIIDDYIHFLNKNTLFVGMMMFVMNIASRFVNIKLSKSMEGYLKYSFSKNILIFTIAFIGTRNLYAALAITFVFWICFDFLFNEESIFCCLPDSFTQHHISLMDNSGNILGDIGKSIGGNGDSTEKAPGMGD